MSTTYISCACNCQPRAVDWAKNGLVCYGSSHSIAIYDPDTENTGKVLKTLHKHSSQVKVVQWLERGNDVPEDELLSGSLDGTIIVWKKSEESYTPDTILTLGDQLTTTHAAYLSQNPVQDNSLLIIASSFKEIFTIWHRNASGTIEEKQILDLKGRVPTEARISHLPGSSRSPLIIIATEDASLHLFTWKIEETPGKPDFQLSKHLTGHQDWIQCLDIVDLTPEASMLASGSQDGTIRLWKISVSQEDKPEEDRVNDFKVGGEHFEVTLESILSGHEHWVYGVHWHPAVKVGDEWRRPNKLLSSALDKTMIIWEPNAAGVWMETVRLGKVGGNTLGFYSGSFNIDGTSVLAHGYQGTFHMWKFQENRWVPRSAPSGHFAEVNDLHWEPEGRYLITTSSDQTTRIHVSFKTTKNSEIWHEIARPQIHGYDINCLTMLNSEMFASGAEEKVVRIFEAPEDFKRSLKTEEWKNPRSTAGRTAVPALGLTNKAVEAEDLEEETDTDVEERPPTEEETVRYTLWPELEKLYGHGYEIFAMAARKDGRILATSCKSSSVEHSSVILWSTQTWGQVQKLSGHRLTVTQMEFSPDDRFLVSVSRDRRWALYKEVQSGKSVEYQVVLVSPAANALHARIIWCCCWSSDSKYFATGSREGKIGVWSVDLLVGGGNPQPVVSLDLGGQSVTALAFSREVFQGNVYFLAVGIEEGRIQLKKMVVDSDSARFVDCLELDTTSAHHRTVKRLSFRPSKGGLQLASCGADRAVKIYDFKVESLLEI